MSALSELTVQAIRDGVREGIADAIVLRHELHANARCSGDEGDTLERMLEALPPGGVVTEVAHHGAVVAYDGHGPAVAIRAELDALPLREDTGVSWASTTGAMHACGHDVHMAALVAVVRAVRSVGLPIVAILQPREETYPSGARDVVESGILTGVAAVIGAHVQPTLAPGTVSTTAGAVNAAADEFRVLLRGREGHAAYPHLTRDPVVAAGQFVSAAQQIVSRTVDPMHPSVLTIGTIHGGSAANAIPADVVMRGIIRTMLPSDRDAVHARLRDVAHGIAHAHGCEAEVSIDRGEPVLVNDPHLSASARQHLLGWGAADAGEVRSCGADDFAYFGEHHRAIMMFVGVDGHGHGLHTRSFLPDDRAISDVAQAMLAGYLAAYDGLADPTETRELIETAPPGDRVSPP